MRPNLIPQSFITKNMRKKYYKRQAQRTWRQYIQEYQSLILLGSGVLMIAFILYIKYTDKLRNQKKNDENLL